MEERKILMVIAPQDFRDEEYFDTRGVLESHGFSVVTASRERGDIQGMLGGTAKAEIVLGRVNPEEYDAVIFIGGTGSSKYFKDEDALSLARKAEEKGKVLAAICIAPSILANAGLLRGRNATAFQSERSNLEEKGAKYTGKDVTRDGRIITGSGPKAAREFGEEIVKALK